MWKHKILLIALLAALSLFVGLFAGKVEEKERARLRNEEGYSVFLRPYRPRISAPAFALDTLDGEEVSLADLRGRVVMISFRTTW